MVICNYCGKEKLEMDMNSKDKCKICWIKKETKFYLERNKKAWTTYYKNREKIYFNGQFLENINQTLFLQEEKRKKD